MMAVNVVQSALSSRRFNRWLLLIGAAVLAAGAIAVLVTYFGNTATVEPSQPTGPPIQYAKAPKNIPFPNAAWKVAHEFILTAVARRNLAESYWISSPDLRGGLTLKEWKTGNIPVIFYPVGQVLKTNWKNTNYAHPRDAQINVILVSKAGSSQKPLNAQVGLTKIGTGAQARWTVSYYGPLGGPPVPSPK
jgi:hypothetical protein